MHRLLLIDDDERVLNALSRLLKLTPLMVQGQASRPRVEAFSSPAEALRRAGECSFDAVVSDYRMPGMDGVEVLKRMRALQPDCARLILSGYTDLNGLIGAINEARIDRFIAKPWNDFELVSTLGQVLEIRALRLENEALADQTRLRQGALSAADLEMKRLERLEPGITQVHWGPDGSVVIDMDDLAAGLDDRGH